MDSAAGPSVVPKVEPINHPPSKPRFPLAIVFLVLVLVVLVTVMVTLAMPEIFASTARLKIEPDHADIPGLAGNEDGSAYDSHFIQTELEILQSEVVLAPVVSELGLNLKWGRELGDGNPFKTSESLGLLKCRLRVRPVSETSLVEIRVMDQKSEMASKLANAVAQAYQEYRHRQRQDKISSSIRVLDEASKENDARIREARAQIADLSRQSGEANPDRLADLKRNLDGLLRADQTLTAKILAEKTDLELPALSMAQVVDRALPATRPIRPDVQMNVIVAISGGAIAGLFLATVIYLLRLRTYWRTTNAARDQLPERVRAIVHFCVALVVGVIIGYFCASPLDLTTFIIVPIALIVGGIVSAWIELAGLTSGNPARGARPALVGSSA